MVPEWFQRVLEAAGREKLKVDVAEELAPNALYEHLRRGQVERGKAMISPRWTGDPADSPMMRAYVELVTRRG